LKRKGAMRGSVKKQEEEDVVMVETNLELRGNSPRNVNTLVVKPWCYTSTSKFDSKDFFVANKIRRSLKSHDSEGCRYTSKMGDEQLLEKDEEFFIEGILVKNYRKPWKG
jgi:hypothetical protein